MKNFIVACFMLMLITGFSHAGIATPSTETKVTQYFDVGNPITFGNDKFYLAWSSRPYDFYMLQEYLPQGESFETYSQMFTASVMFYGNAPFNSTKAVEYKIAELEEIKKTDDVCNYTVLENNGEYLLDFIVSKTGDDGQLEFVEVDIHYYRDIVVNGTNANYLLFYSIRAYGDDIMPFLESIPSRREQWYHDLTTLNLTPSFQFSK